uniref:WAT1-related protein n=1 Tax=Salix viminalis TaxID=40686 RepID=A0A6N2KBE8_SALVM
MMEAGGRVKKCFVSSQAVMSMLMVQVMATGMQLLSKIILNNGTFVLALMTYRHVVAALCMAPFAFYFERGIKSKMNWSVFFWLFLNSLSGILFAMGLFYYGLKYTTATYAVNFLNLVPIVTFVFSIIFRLEKLGLSTRAGKIKISGAILCVSGAMLACLYKGKTFHLIHKTLQHHVQVNSSVAHMARGTIMLIGIIGLCLDRSSAAWKLEWNLQLLTIIYSGSLASAATFCLISWAVVRRGPSYPPMFNPLTLIFVAVLEALILGAEITVGTLLGMVLIIIGLYSFLLGKTKEMTNMPKSSMEAATTVESTKVKPASPLTITNEDIESRSVKDSVNP